MAQNTALRKFTKLIEGYGLTIEKGSRHYIVRSGGTQVGVVAGTGETNALRQAIRDLRRGGYVDDAAARIKF